jgi:DNA-binding response OmpR family regulator
MLLVVSEERFGRAMAVRRLRSNGFYTVLAGDAAQAIRRLSSPHQPIDGVVVVGTLGDGNADSLRRWMREHGHPDLAIVAIGAELSADAWAHEVAIEDWDVDGPLGEPVRSLLSARYAPQATGVPIAA